MKTRFILTLNCLLLISLIITSCGGAPNLPNFISPATPTVPPTPPSITGQAAPPALIETDPPLNTVIGHQSPITFYFNQGMNKASAESALSGLPVGTFTWNDEASLVFTPTQSYIPNTKLDIEIGNTIQSASGFGIAEPIQASFIVADYLRLLMWTRPLPSRSTSLSFHLARPLFHYPCLLRSNHPLRGTVNGSTPARMSFTRNPPCWAGRNIPLA